MKCLVFLCLLPTVFCGYLESLAASAAVRSTSERFQGMVAFRCGRPSIHLTPLGAWVRDLYQDCVTSPDEVRTYCQRMYPKLEIVNVEPAPNDVLIENWCDFHTDRCDTSENRHEVLVRPYRCLVAGFQSDALLVPSNCSFGHIVPGISTDVGETGKTKRECKTYEQWNSTATAECQKRFPGYKLQRYGALVACKKDDKHKYGLYEGVEFVCCPKNQVIQPPSHGRVTDQINSNPASKSTPKRDQYLDYLNRAEDSEESEHDRYVDAKDARKKKMTEDEDRLVKSFIEAENDMSRKWDINPAAAKDEEKTIIQRFRTAFNALLNEEMAELRQLDHIHQQRVFDKLHRKSVRCKKMLEYVSQETDPKLERITSAAFSFLRAVMKEKVHAINHHTHLLDTDPEEATKQLPHLRKYLVKLHKDIKSIIDKLVREVPTLQKQLRVRILKFMRSYSEVESSAQSLEQTGHLSANPIKGQSRKDVEVDHMESVIRAYQHQPVVDKHPTEHHEEKMVHVVPVKDDDLDEEVDLEEKGHHFETNVHHTGGQPGHLAKAMHHGNEEEHDDDHDHDDGHYEGDGHDHRFQRAHIVRGSGSAGTWTIIGCVAGVALVAAITALLVLRRRYAGYTMSAGSDPATVAIDRSLPPSAIDGGAAGDLAAMQTNGYENPTYKYFELNGKEEIADTEVSKA